MDREEGIATFDAIVGLGGTPWLRWDPDIKQYSVAILDSRLEHHALASILSVAQSAGGKVVLDRDRLEIY